MASEQIITLITGANSGIGYEVTKNLTLYSEKYHVYLGSRSLQKGEDVAAEIRGFGIKGTITPIQIDVTSTESIAAAAAIISDAHGRIDVLVNNAGIVSRLPPGVESLRETMETNVIGSVAVTEAFKCLLLKSSDPRLIFVTSSLGSITHASNPESTYYKPRVGILFSEYRISKAALNMAMAEYGKILEGKVKIWAADPGINKTNLLGPENKHKSKAPGAEHGGEVIAAVVRGDRDVDVGRFVGVYGIQDW